MISLVKIQVVILTRELKLTKQEEFLEACELDEIKIVKQLINTVDINCKNIAGRTGLILAAQNDNLKIVKLLVQQGADIEIKDWNRYNALTYSSSYEYSDIASFLVESGSTLELKDSGGNTPLIFSAVYDMKNLMLALINKGADLDKKNFQGDTALMFAVSRSSSELVELLIKSGANVKLKNKEKKTAYDIAVMRIDLNSMYLINPEMASIRDKNGDTLLIRGCQGKDEEIVMFLHEKGADFSIENAKGESAYQILKRKKNLPDRLQALKEKLMLDRLVENTPCLNS